MDDFRLELSEVRLGTWLTQSMAIFVNGRPLEELAREVERPFAEAEGSPKLAGDYLPLTVDAIRRDRQHFLGAPVASWFDDGDTVLMGCTCGEWGCWPLTAHVTLEDSAVGWSRFRNGHRDWDLAGLGPFTFARGDYEASLAAIL